LNIIPPGEDGLNDIALPPGEEADATLYRCSPIMLGVAIGCARARGIVPVPERGDAGV
jgi:hypothetical protein